MEFKLPPATHVSKISVLMTTVTARKSGMSHLNFARAVKGTSAGVVTLFTNARNATVVSHAMNARKTYRARPKTVRMVLTILIVQTALTRSYFGCLVARNMFVTVAVAMLVIAAVRAITVMLTKCSGHRRHMSLLEIKFHLSLFDFFQLGIIWSFREKKGGYSDSLSVTSSCHWDVHEDRSFEISRR